MRRPFGRRTGCPPGGCAPTQKTRPPKFVVNLRDAAWKTNDHLGAMCAFEGESAPFADLGINLRVLQPDPRSSRWFQISATLPFSKRKMLTPEKVALRPVGSIAPHAPR